MHTNLSELLEEARGLAFGYPGNAGLASVKLEWHPYESGWVAEASWSDNTRIRTVTVADRPEAAVVRLINLLYYGNEDPTQCLARGQEQADPR